MAPTLLSSTSSSSSSSPPVISAPTLVTSTNLATLRDSSSLNNNSNSNEKDSGINSNATFYISNNENNNPSLSVNANEVDWQKRYLAARTSYRKVKDQVRDQSKKSRQLIVAVKTKLEKDEEEIAKVSFKKIVKLIWPIS